MVEKDSGRGFARAKEELGGEREKEKTQSVGQRGEDYGRHSQTVERGTDGQTDGGMDGPGRGGKRGGREGDRERDDWVGQQPDALRQTVKLHRRFRKPSFVLVVIVVVVGRPHD